MAFILPCVLILVTNNCVKEQRKKFERRESYQDGKFCHDYVERLL